MKNLLLFPETTPINPVVQPNTVAGETVAAALTSGTIVPEVSGIAFVGGEFCLFSDEQPGMYVVNSLNDIGSAKPASYDITFMSDMEAAGVDQGGSLWICTSHSVTSSGKDKAERKKLVRIEYPTMPLIRRVKTYSYLRETIVAASNCPTTLKSSVGKLGDAGGFNIEGIALVPDFVLSKTSVLLVGFRSPLTSGNAAFIARIKRPDKLMNYTGVANATDIGLSFMSLDLGGLGIRDMHWDNLRRRLFIIAGTMTDVNDKFKLFEFDIYDWRTISVTNIPSKLSGSTEKFIAESVIRDGDGVTIVSDNKVGKAQVYHIPFTALVPIGRT